MVHPTKNVPNHFSSTFQSISYFLRSYVLAIKWLVRSKNFKAYLGSKQFWKRADQQILDEFHFCVSINPKIPIDNFFFGGDSSDFIRPPKFFTGKEMVKCTLAILVMEVFAVTRKMHRCHLTKKCVQEMIFKILI